MKYEPNKSLILLEASTGIEPVYTDLQSAASPLRQLAVRGVGVAVANSSVAGLQELSDAKFAASSVAEGGAIWHI